MTSKLWEDGWRERVYSAVKEAGSDSVTAFAYLHQALPYRELLQFLPQPVAPVQLEHLLREEAESQGQLREFAKDCLVRNLSQKLPNGWPSEPAGDFDVARAFASWSAAVGETNQHQVDHVHNYLIGNAGAGWRPLGIFDPLLIAAFEAQQFS